MDITRVGLGAWFLAVAGVTGAIVGAGTAHPAVMA